MNDRRLRVVSLIALLGVALMLTGLSESVAAALLEKAEKSCCEECNKGASQKADHCSTPDCPIFVCLSMDMESPFTLSRSFEGGYIPQFNRELILELLAQSIFHPPKTAA